MNTPRATVGIAIFFLAAALSLAGTHQRHERLAAVNADPSVPPASEAFRQGETKNASQGNVEDMTY